MFSKSQTSNKHKADLLIASSILKNRKYVVSFFVCALVCFIILPVIPMYSVIMTRANIDNIENRCGRYDLETDSGSEAVKLEPGNSAVESVCFFRSESYFVDGGHTLNVVFATSDVIDMTPYRIVQGRFPEKKNEIACESWFLRRFGLSSEEMIGASVRIEDADYKVVGVLVYTGPVILDNNSSLSFCFSESETEQAYVNLSEGADAQKFISDNGLSRDAWGLNFGKEEAISESSSSDLSLYIVFGVSVLSSFFVIGEMASFLMEKNRDNIAVLQKNGIYAGKIKIIILTVFAALLMPAAIAGLCFQIIEKHVLTAVFFPQYEGLTKEIGMSGMTLYNVVIALSAVSATLISVFYSGFRRELKIKPQKNGIRMKIGRAIFVRTAANNLRSTRMISVAVAVSITLVIILMNTVSFWVRTVEADQIDYGDTQYLVTYSPYAVFSEENTAKLREVSQALLNDDCLKAEQTKIAYSSVNVDKSVISQKYADYLKMYPDFYAAYTNNMKKNVAIPIGLTTADSLSVSGVQNIPEITDEKGLILRNPYNFDYPGFDGNFKIRLNSTAGDLELAVSDLTVGKNFYTNDVFAIVVVSENVYEKCSENVFVDTVYIHGDVPEDYLIHSIPDLSLVRIEAIGEIRANEEAAFKTINAIISGLFLITALYSMICLTVSCLLREALFGKEYAMLNVLGVPQKQILRVPVYEFSIILASVLFFSALGTWGGASLIVMFSKSMVVKRMLPFPIVSFAISAAILIAVSLAFIFVSVLSMRKNSAIQCIVNR